MTANSLPALAAAPLSTSIPTSTRTRWGARLLGALPVLMLVFSGTIKLLGHPEVAASMTRLGIPGDLALLIGVIELACVALYLIPRTAVLGAILATGLLGGAVASHLRIGDPLPTHTLFPIYVGALLWASLYLRDARVRALLARR